MWVPGCVVDRWAELCGFWSGGLADSVFSCFVCCFVGRMLALLIDAMEVGDWGGGAVCVCGWWGAGWLVGWVVVAVSGLTLWLQRCVFVRLLRHGGCQSWVQPACWRGLALSWCQVGGSVVAWLGGIWSIAFLLGGGFPVGNS